MYVCLIVTKTHTHTHTHNSECEHRSHDTCDGLTDSHCLATPCAATSCSVCCFSTPTHPAKCRTSIIRLSRFPHTASGCYCCCCYCCCCCCCCCMVIAITREKRLLIAIFYLSFSFSYAVAAERFLALYFEHY